MNDFVGTLQFVTFSIVLILECVKTLALGTAAAFYRMQKKKFINQEDVNWLGGELVSLALDPSARLTRAHRNNIENLLPFSILGFLYVFLNASATLGIVYFLLFFMGRVLHTYAYVSARPMLRRNTYSLAWLVMMVMSIHLLWIIIGGAL